MDSSAIEAYCEAHTSAETDVLASLNRYTHANVLQPRMLSGHIQGRLLSLLAKLKHPKNILEIGTFTGYATLCLAEGLKADGHLYTIEVNEEVAVIAQKYIDQTAYKDQITVCIGNAAEIIPGFDFKFDLVFIDADKKNYDRYFEMMAPRLNPGAIVLIDNVLWSGKVLETEAKDAKTEAMRRINDLVQQDNRFENILLPIRDGLMMARLL